MFWKGCNGKHRSLHFYLKPCEGQYCDSTATCAEEEPLYSECWQLNAMFFIHGARALRWRLYLRLSKKNLFFLEYLLTRKIQENMAVFYLFCFILIWESLLLNQQTAMFSSIFYSNCTTMQPPHWMGNLIHFVVKSVGRVLGALPYM